MQLDAEAKYMAEEAASKNPFMDADGIAALVIGHRLAASFRAKFTERWEAKARAAAVAATWRP